MIPASKGTLAFTDVLRMYDLRMYFNSKHLASDKGDQYVTELEYFHHELNHKTSFDYLKRLSIFLFLLSLYYYLKEEDKGEKLNWKEKWNLVHDMKVFAELDEGGEEGDEPETI
jgi:hypothetical protein